MTNGTGLFDRVNRFRDRLGCNKVSKIKLGVVEK